MTITNDFDPDADTIRTIANRAADWLTPDASRLAGDDGLDRASEAILNRQATPCWQPAYDAAAQVLATLQADACRQAVAHAIATVTVTKTDDTARAGVLARRAAAYWHGIRLAQAATQTRAQIASGE